MRTLFLGLLVTLLTAHSVQAEKLTSLGTTPNWSLLELYQEQITQSDFRWLLDTLYVPYDDWKPWITLSKDHALIQTDSSGHRAPFRLNFRDPGTAQYPPPTYWKSKAAILAIKREKPLSNVHIALDPGHIGGKFGKLEQRSWNLEGGPLIQEGNIVLHIAKRLQKELEQLGAKVSLTRETNEPVTTDRPDTLRPKAKKWLTQKNRQLPGIPDTQKIDAAAIERLSNLLFYRVSEIHARAKKVNELIKPDLVICLHLNAEAFPKAPQRTLVKQNHLHLLINGAYSAEEIAFDDQRFELFNKLLNGSWQEEQGLATAIAKQMATITGLPPFTYHGENAIRANTSPYIWARNLLANRLYQCPVVFIEAYVANSEPVYERLILGDYVGLKNVGGKKQQSIYSEYIEGIVAGLVNYYSSEK